MVSVIAPANGGHRPPLQLSPRHHQIVRRKLEDEIRRAVRADVAQAVQFIRRLEDDMPPAVTMFVWSPCNAASVPSLTTINSSSACRCGGCGDSPGLSVVMWHSNSASVGVGASQTDRRSPCFVGTALRSAQLKTHECSPGLPVDCASAMPATAMKMETAATVKSRRVIIRAFRRESETKSSGQMFSP
jgi:hypothetical protein